MSNRIGSVGELDYISGSISIDETRHEILASQRLIEVLTHLSEQALLARDAVRGSDDGIITKGTHAAILELCNLAGATKECIGVYE